MKKSFCTLLVILSLAIFNFQGANADEAITINDTSLVTEADILEYIYMFETIGTDPLQTVYLISQDIDTGTMVFIVKSEHIQDFGFATSFSFRIYDPETSLEVSIADGYDSAHLDANDVYLHKFTVSNLEVGKEYYFRVVENNPDENFTKVEQSFYKTLEKKSVISEVFTALQVPIIGFINLFVAIFADTGTIAVFYSVDNGLTVVGALLVIVFSFTLVKWSFTKVRQLLVMRF